MNRHDVHVYQQIRGYPCLTVTIPPHRTAPDNKQDPIRVKNLVNEAAERLLKEFNKAEIQSLLMRLEQLAQSIEYRYVLDGLAMFVHHDFARLIYLPFTLKEQVVIGDSFYTRDLVFALNRTPRYWTLVLSEKPTRLYECIREDFTEIQEGGFPMVHEGPGGEKPLPGGFGIRKSAYRDERHRQFFRQVDSALKPYMVEDTLPLVVVGVKRFLAFFKEVSSHTDAILTTLTGNYDKTSEHELGKLIWPKARQNIVEQRRLKLAELEKAIGERKYASTVGEVWRMAKEGRGRLLLVEEDFHYPARLNASDSQIIPAEGVTAPDVYEDIVDEIIETVLEKQGQVFFMENGQLEEHQRIALILRY